MLRYFRVVGFLEAVSFLLLLGVAMPLKYLYHRPEFVSVVGMAHGLLFLLYCHAAVTLASQEKWPAKQTVLALVAAFLPAGPFIFDRKYL